MVGKTLKHYRVLEKLGRQGAVATVYRARDTRLGRVVALKVLEEGFSDALESKRRFFQEARCASSLNHPHIVTIYEIEQGKGHDFIVMEYIPGETLDRVIPRGGLPLSVCINYGLQVADALSKAHTAGIIHRDIKASNIMVSDNVLKLLDFGLAKPLTGVTEKDRPLALPQDSSWNNPRHGRLYGA